MLYKEFSDDDLKARVDIYKKRLEAEEEEKDFITKTYTQLLKASNNKHKAIMLEINYMNDELERRKTK